MGEFMSMDIKYRRAFSEVLKVLNHSDVKIKGRVPVNFIKFLAENADETYTVTLDCNKKLMEQNLMDESKIILSMIYRDYVCSEDRKEELKKYMEKIIAENSGKNRRVFENIKENENERPEKELPYEKKEHKKLLDKIMSIFKGFKRW